MTERADFERIAAMEEAVWGDDHGYLAASLANLRAADPEALVVVVAEAGDEVVCAAWMRFPPATEFATLWGGATLPNGAGAASTAPSSRTARGSPRSAGCRYLQVDASDDSRPILERLGFVAVTTTTPFVWTPPPAR